MPGIARGERREPEWRVDHDAPSGPIEGVDTGDSTLFPNRANGTVYGEYVKPGKQSRNTSARGAWSTRPGRRRAHRGPLRDRPGNRRPSPARSSSSPATAKEGAVRGLRREQLRDDAGMVEHGGRPPTPTRRATWRCWCSRRAPKPAQSVEATVGSFAIAFEQPREQTYTQWGYPGESPYNGEILYSHTTPYAGGDPFYPAAVRPIKIASDFTAGASGGPWTVGPTSAPTVLSVTDYYYRSDPRHLYGAYFGSRRPRRLRNGRRGRRAAGDDGGVGEPDGPRRADAGAYSRRPPPASTTVLGHRQRAHPLRSRPLDSRRSDGRRRGRRPGDAAAERPGGADRLRRRRSRGQLPARAERQGGRSAARTLRRRGSVTVGVWVRFTSPVGVRQASRLVRLFTRPN